MCKRCWMAVEKIVAQAPFWCEVSFR
ncbi:MAG: hypothetical protein IT466_08140 [Moraxellaceae bacterium]|nr:hypothetical protein [Moraxellaceae bacterium]MCC6200727.1 hypothetical protein [Moraxellaceae bacterium]